MNSPGSPDEPRAGYIRAYRAYRTAWAEYDGSLRMHGSDNPATVKAAQCFAKAVADLRAARIRKTDGSKGQ